MPRRKLPVTPTLSSQDAESANSFNAEFLVNPTEDDLSRMSAAELLKLLLEKNKNPAIKTLLLALSKKIPCDAAEVVGSEKQSRSIVISGLPEADHSLPPSERQMQLESKITKVLDTIDVECRPCEVYRMGRMDGRSTRLVKVVLPTRAHWRTALNNAKALRSSSEFSSVFIRRSMSFEERKKEFELRQIVKERNAGKPQKEWVIYKGEIRRKSDLSQQGNF